MHTEKNYTTLQRTIPFLMAGVITLFILGSLSVSAQTSLSPTNDELDRIVNERFGFAFMYPKNWIKSEPLNGDGFSFTHPKNDKVKILGSAMYYMGGVHPEIPNDGKFTLEEYLEKSYGIAKDAILYDVYAPCDAEDWDKTTQTPRLTKAVAREVSFKKGGYINVLLVAIHDGRVISIQCEAPETEFEAYKDLFAAITGSTQILPQP